VEDAAKRALALGHFGRGAEALGDPIAAVGQAEADQADAEVGRSFA